MKYNKLLLSTAMISAMCASSFSLAATTDQRIARMESQIQQLRQDVHKDSAGTRHHYTGKDWRERLKNHLGRRITVSTTPMLGLRGEDILYNVPSMNEDLLLLKRRMMVEEKLNSVGLSLDKKPLVGISGAMEGTVTAQNGFNTSSGTTINLSTAELDVGVMVNSWVNTFMSITYDSSPFGTGSRVTNSRLYLQRGFLTIGNLDKTPFYMTIGQMYVPFGAYKSAMLTTPLTKSLARVDARAVVAGYSSGPLFAEAYAYSSDQNSADSWPKTSVGANVGYNGERGGNNYRMSAGVISNIADSQGAQANGIGAAGQFQGFSTIGRWLRHKVPGLDLNANWHMDDWTFIGEYITNLRSYSVDDMTFNNSGARPGALHAEVDYLIHVFGSPATIAVGYGHTWQALALNLPQNTYFALLDVAVWRHTLIGAEFRHDVNYSQQAATAVSGGGLPVGEANVGGTRNIFTLRFGAYF